MYLHITHIDTHMYTHNYMLHADICTTHMTTDGHTYMAYSHTYHTHNQCVSSPCPLTYTPTHTEPTPQLMSHKMDRQVLHILTPHDTQ